MKEKNVLAIIVPCYNEQEVLPQTIRVLSVFLDKLIGKKMISSKSSICFIDDGSKDKTWQIITKAHKRNPQIEGISLSRNFGHQSALLAGLYTKNADLYITIDADLQDSPSVMEDMLLEYQKGCDIVYGVRNKRDTDSFLKKFFALSFYKIMQILKVDIIYNHADFRLMSHRAVNTLKQFGERNLFLRAMVPLLGFKSSKVYYDRTPRLQGDSKYPFIKSLGLAIDGITSFSVFPLHCIIIFGLAVCIISIGVMIYALTSYFRDSVLWGWTSLIMVMSFFFGCSFVCLGIIGEYIGKIYIEVKSRPSFIVDEVLIGESVHVHKN